MYAKAKADKIEMVSLKGSVYWQKTGKKKHGVVMYSLVE